MPTYNDSAPQQLADANSQGTLIGPALDSNGNPYKLGFLGAAPFASAAYSPTGQSAATGGVGATSYTLGDLVYIFKTLGLIKM